MTKKDVYKDEAEELKKELEFFEEDKPAPEAPAIEQKPIKDWSNIPAGSISDLIVQTEKPRTEIISWPIWSEKDQAMVEKKFEIGIVDLSWEKLNQIIDDAYNQTQSILGRKRKVQIAQMKVQIKTIAGSVPVWQTLDPYFCERLRMTLFGELEDDRASSLMEGEILKNLLVTLMRDPAFIDNIRKESQAGQGQGRTARNRNSTGTRKR